MPVSPFLTTNLHQSAERRQVVELIDIMSPQTVPLLKLLGIDGEPGRNPKLEWLEDTLLAETGTLGSALAAGATTVNVASTTGFNFQAGEVIKITDTSNQASPNYEYMYITAVNTDALTVVRGVAGTASYAFSFASGSVIDIIGLANSEGATAPVKGTTDLVIPFNYFQDFDTSYQISYKEANTDIYGVPEGDDSRELEKAFKEVTVKLERSAFLGFRALANGSVPNLMGGLDYFLSSTYPQFAGYSANLTTSGSAADLAEKDINDCLQAIYYAVGEENMAKTIICGVWNKRRINDIYAPSHRAAQNERTGGVVVTTIDTDFGPIDVVYSLRCPKDTLYFAKLDFISIHPYMGLAFFDQELSRTGAYIQREIFGSYTMALRNSKAMGVIRGTSTS